MTITVRGSRRNIHGRSTADRPVIARMSSGDWAESYDAGMMIIDLEKRFRINE